jgi:hypothetical protein
LGLTPELSVSAVAKIRVSQVTTLWGLRAVTTWGLMMVREFWVEARLMGCVFNASFVRFVAVTEQGYLVH